MSVLPTVTGAEQFDKDELAVWIRRHDPDKRSVKVHNVRPASLTAGWSNRTWLVDLVQNRSGVPTPDTVVVRAGPADAAQGYFPKPSVARQCAVLEALGRRTSLPVPGVLFRDPEGGPIGAECFVMEHLQGEIPGDAPPFLVQGFVASASDEQRATLWESTIAAIADVGRVEGSRIVPEVSAEDVHGGRSGQEELERWLAHYRWARQDQEEPIAEIDVVIDWLAQHVPDQVGDRLLWGDARFANVVYRDFRVTGLLDWELADVGDPANDLAYFLVLERMAEAGMGARRHARPRPPSFWSERRTVDRHAELTGVPAKHLRYYWVLNIFKLIAMMQRMAWLLETAGLSSPESADRRRRSPLLINWATTAMREERFLDVANPRA